MAFALLLSGVFGYLVWTHVEDIRSDRSVGASRRHWCAPLGSSGWAKHVHHAGAAA